MLTVACVNVGNYCGQGERYVRRLRAGVLRWLTVPHRFVVMTDAPIEGLECIPAPPADEAPGWWAKLALFGEFTRGRTLFFDLDTIIVGPLDHLVNSLPWGFATLRDFYRPHGLGSGIMCWCNDWSFIWTEWQQAGRPRVRGGDQAWIERSVPDHWIDRLQDLSGAVVSYKADRCKAGPPTGAAVVCFHGQPKPHDITSGWVPEVWTE